MLFRLLSPRARQPQGSRRPTRPFAALALIGIELGDAAIWLRDHELIHALRDSKSSRSAALPMDVWLNLADYLDKAEPYLDTVNGTLLYAFDLPGVTGKVVVRVNHTRKIKDGGKRKNISSNFIVTGGVVDKADMEVKQFMPLLKEAP